MLQKAAKECRHATGDGQRTGMRQETARDCGHSTGDAGDLVQEQVTDQRLVT